MYPNPIIISDGATNINFEFGGSSIDESKYRDASAALDQEHTLVVKHQRTGSGITRMRRTLIRIDKIVEDAQGVQGLLSWYTNVIIPEGIATTAQVVQQVTLGKSFLSTAGFIAKVVAAEI